MEFTFLTKTPNIVVDYMKSYTKIKLPDCSFYTEDGNEIPVHKELLYQTKLMENLIKSLDCCCSKIEIVLPSVSIEELDLMVEFLYCGQISCTNSNLAGRVSSNLQKFLGFSTSLYISKVIPNNYFEKDVISNNQYFSNRTGGKEEEENSMSIDTTSDFLSENESLEVNTEEILVRSCNSSEKKKIFCATCEFCGKNFSNNDNLTKHKLLRCEKSVESVQDEAENAVTEEFSSDLLSNNEKDKGIFDKTSEVDPEWDLEDELDSTIQGFLFTRFVFIHSE